MKMRKYLICGCCVLGLLLGGAGAEEVSLDLPETEEQVVTSVLEIQGDTLEMATEVHQVDVWQVEEEELGTMHGDPWVLRRTSNAREAYVTFDFSYMETVEVLSYSWPSHIAPFAIFVSADGEEWQEAETEIIMTPSEDGTAWTQILHRAENLVGTRYCRVVWPEPMEDANDWWNPYFGWIKANVGTPTASEIRVEGSEKLMIPRYDAKEYILTAAVVDQMGIPMDQPLYWRAKEALPTGVTLTREGVLTVQSDCEADQQLTLIVSTKENLSEESGESEKEPLEEPLDEPLEEPAEETVEVAEPSEIPEETEGSKEAPEELKEKVLEKEMVLTLEAARTGDWNYDGYLNEEDFQKACLGFGKKEGDEHWQEFRLVDVNLDGKIDIADLSYLAYYGTFSTIEGEEEGEKV